MIREKEHRPLLAFRLWSGTNLVLIHKVFAKMQIIYQTDTQVCCSCRDVSIHCFLAVIYGSICVVCSTCDQLIIQPIIVDETSSQAPRGILTFEKKSRHPQLLGMSESRALFTLDLFTLKFNGKQYKANSASLILTSHSPKKLWI